MLDLEQLGWLRLSRGPSSMRHIPKETAQKLENLTPKRDSSRLGLTDALNGIAGTCLCLPRLEGYKLPTSWCFL